MTDDRQMNLVIRPDGTAELDDRTPEEVVLATLGHRHLAVNLTVDSRLVGTAHALVDDTEDINHLARLAVVELTGAHFAFMGPVVLTGLAAGTAHLLLELARDSS
jgi:hypothetical protein